MCYCENCDFGATPVKKKNKKKINLKSIKPTTNHQKQKIPKEKLIKIFLCTKSKNLLYALHCQYIDQQNDDFKLLKRFQKSKFLKEKNTTKLIEESSFKLFI
ncbi:unnamed protein product [Ceratitis capitata]|uniref:(Mediterranean fruit fly) hypothetical protein n=1 Tax=Ceratitis capitata TaxID=7213 RepID=A0A811V0K8_CERCA|nr:unnamed protein product [Ceratitis capitata]